MIYEIIDWKVFQKSYKGKKKGMNQQNQENPMNLEDLDYDIPEMPYAEEMLKEIKKDKCEDQLLGLLLFPRLET